MWNQKSVLWLWVIFTRFVCFLCSFHIILKAKNILFIIIFTFICCYICCVLICELHLAVNTITNCYKHLLIFCFFCSIFVLYFYLKKNQKQQQQKKRKNKYTIFNARFSDTVFACSNLKYLNSWYNTIKHTHKSS